MGRLDGLNEQSQVWTELDLSAAQISVLAGNATGTVLQQVKDAGDFSSVYDNAVLVNDKLREFMAAADRQRQVNYVNKGVVSDEIKGLDDEGGYLEQLYVRLNPSTLPVSGDAELSSMMVLLQQVYAKYLQRKELMYRLAQIAKSEAKVIAEKQVLLDVTSSMNSMLISMRALGV